MTFISNSAVKIKDLKAYVGFFCLKIFKRKKNKDFHLKILYGHPLFFLNSYVYLSMNFLYQLLLKIILCIFL